jgi:hypothetical protein
MKTTKNPVSKISQDTHNKTVGQCQICECTFAVHNGVLVHHGFKRPGDGQIHGDCDGVGEFPYETSCERVKDLVEAHEDLEKNLEWSLHSINSGKVTSCRIKEWDYVSGYSMITVDKTSDPIAFSRALDRLRDGKERDLRDTKARLVHLRERVSSWQLRPLTSLEVYNAAISKEKSEVKEAKAQQKLAKDAKKEETRKKKQELHEKRLAMVVDLSKVLLAFYKAEDFEGAKAWYRKLSATKYTWRYSFGPEQADGSSAHYDTFNVPNNVGLELGLCRVHPNRPAEVIWNHPANV